MEEEGGARGWVRVWEGGAGGGHWGRDPAEWGNNSHTLSPASAEPGPSARHPVEAHTHQPGSRLEEAQTPAPHTHTHKTKMDPLSLLL